MTQGALWKYVRHGNNGSVVVCPCEKPTLGKHRLWSITIDGILTKPKYDYCYSGIPEDHANPDSAGVRYGVFRRASLLPMTICENTDPVLGPVVNDNVFCNHDITSYAHNEHAAICFLDGHCGKTKGGLPWTPNTKDANGRGLFIPPN